MNQTNILKKAVIKTTTNSKTINKLWQKSKRSFKTRSKNIISGLNTNR